MSFDEKSLDVLTWDAITRMYVKQKESHSLWLAARVSLLHLDLMYRVGRWDGRGWPEGQ